MRFGDADYSDAGSDLEYNGEESSSALSMDYYRRKYTEFQSALNAADQSYRALIVARSSATGDARTELADLAYEYESNFSRMRAVAQAMNAGASMLNAIGVRMPVLSIPTTLGLPIAIPAAAVAAVAAAAALVTWVREWSARVSEASKRAEREAIINNAPPEQQATLRAAAIQATQASNVASNSAGFIGTILGSNTASIFKWVAIGAGAFLVIKTLRSLR